MLVCRTGVTTWKRKIVLICADVGFSWANFIFELFVAVEYDQDTLVGIGLAR